MDLSSHLNLPPSHDHLSHNLPSPPSSQLSFSPSERSTIYPFLISSPPLFLSNHGLIVNVRWDEMVDEMRWDDRWDWKIISDHLPSTISFLSFYWVGVAERWRWKKEEWSWGYHLQCLSFSLLPSHLIYFSFFNHQTKSSFQVIKWHVISSNLPSHLINLPSHLINYLSHQLTISSHVWYRVGRWDQDLMVTLTTFISTPQKRDYWW